MKKAILFVVLIFAMALSAIAAPSIGTLTQSQATNPKSVTFAYTAAITENTLCSFSSNETFSGSYAEQINTSSATSVSKSFSLTFNFDNRNVLGTLTCSNGTVQSSMNTTFSIRGTPSFTSTAPTTAKRNGNYTYNVTAADPDSESVTYSLVTAPSGMTISSSGQIFWIPSAIGQSAVTVRATDSSGLYADQSYTITVTTDSLLRIKQVNVQIKGDDNELNNNFGAVSDSDAIMGEKLALYVDTCNDLPSGQDIEKIEGDITIKDLDDGDDIEGTISKFSISGGNCEEKKVKLDLDNIPFTADYKQYTVTVKIEGKNQSNSVTMTDSWTVYFTVYKDSDPNIKISDASAFPHEISCDRRITLDVKGSNIGDSDDNVVLKIEAPTLKIYELKEFEMGDNPDDDCNALEETDEGCFLFDGSFSYNLASNIAPGTYPINVYTYYDTTKQTDKKTVDLKVSKCEDSITQPTTTQPQTTTTTQPTTTQPQTTTTTQPTTTQPQQNQTQVVVVQQPTVSQNNGVVPVTTPVKIVEKSSLADNKYYVALLIAANIGLLAIIAVVLKVVFSPKQ